MRELFLLPAGLVLFLYGIRVLGEGLKELLRESLRKVSGLCERRRLFSLFMGILLSLGVQSGVGAVSLLASMVNAGIFTFTRSIDMMIGISLGSTLTTQILALRASEYSPYMLAFGYFASNLLKGRLKSLGTALWGLGLLFLGMFLMEISFLNARVMELLFDLRSGWMLFLAGALLTLLFQSSALTLGLTISMISRRIFSIDCAFFLILGAHLAISFAVLLVSFGMKREARALAWASLIYRSIGSMASFFLSPALIYIASFFSPEKGVAMLHLSVATLNAAIFFFLTPLLSSVSLRLVSSKGEVEEISEPAFLEESALKVPEWACYLALKESLRIGTFLEYQLLKSRDVFLDGGKPSILKEMGDSISRLISSLSDYLGKIEGMAEDKLRIYTFLGEIKQASELLQDIVNFLLSVGFKREVQSNKEKVEDILDSLIDLLRLSLGAFALSDSLMAKRVEIKKAKIEDKLKRLLVEERFIDKPGWLEFATFAKRFSDQCYYIIEVI